MGIVEVEIIDHTMSKCKRAQIPDDIQIGRVMSVLISKMKLPATDPSGQPMSYHLDHKQSGRRLREDQTLGDASVKDGDMLRISAEITAGAGRVGPAPIKPDYAATLH